MILTSMDEYRALFAKNIRSTGSGQHEHLHVPCPFCAAAEWYEASAAELSQDSSPLYCIACGRSAELRTEDGTMKIHFLA